MREQGFTLIELIMVIAIIAIISIPGGYLMVSLVQNSVFIPNKLNVDMIGQDLIDIMIEGDSLAKGLRSSTLIVVAGNEKVKYKNSDGQTIRFRWDRRGKKIYRKIDAGAEKAIPYYLPNNVSIERPWYRRIFTYYSKGTSRTSRPERVRRIKINLIVKAGTGLYKNWEGYSNQSSSITVRKFE